MKFERKPIEVTPTCAMCGKPINAHTSEQIKSCTQERRKSKEIRMGSDNGQIREKTPLKQD